MLVKESFDLKDKIRVSSAVAVGTCTTLVHYATIQLAVNSVNRKLGRQTG